MPNICNNELTITGPVAQVKRFKKKARWGEGNEALCNNSENNDFQCSKIVPIPNAETDLREFYGTKWNCIGTLTSYEFNIGQNWAEITYNIESAWSPPLEWLRKASIRFPKLTFTMDYEEYGMCFCGTATAEKGELSDEEGTWADRHEDEEDEVDDEDREVCDCEECQTYRRTNPLE